MCIRALRTKTVQRAALVLQRLRHIHNCDNLALGVFRIGNSITDHILREDFENTASLLVARTRDSLDITTAGKTTDSGPGVILERITYNNTMSKLFATHNFSSKDNL